MSPSALGRSMERIPGAEKGTSTPHIYQAVQLICAKVSVPFTQETKVNFTAHATRSNPKLCKGINETLQKPPLSKLVCCLFIKFKLNLNWDKIRFLGSKLLFRCWDRGENRRRLTENRDGRLRNGERCFSFSYLVREIRFYYFWGDEFWRTAGWHQTNWWVDSSRRGEFNKNFG